MRRWKLYAAVSLIGTACAQAASPSGKKAAAKKAPAKKAPAKAAPAPAPKPAEPQPVNLGAVSGMAPGDWTSEPPIGQFRLAQYALPKATGDTAPTLFIVFHFGKGGGGTLEDNIRRWMGMMQQPEGTDVRKVARRHLSEREGLRVTTLELPGTYLERPFPASDRFTERPGYRMLSAVVETTGEQGDGPYYLRIVGPEKSVLAAKPGWDSLVASLKIQ
jgi:hypothetical protein